MRISLRTVAFLLATSVITLGAVSRSGEVTPPRASKGVAAGKLYTCKMHPQIQWSRADDCPLCGMQLVPTKNDRGAPATVHGTRKPADHGTMAMPNHDAMQMDHAGMHSGMGGCGMCMEMMGMGNMNNGSAPAGRKAKTSSGNGRGGRGCGC